MDNFEKMNGIGMMEEEEGFDFGAVIFMLLSHWKSIFLAMLAGAVVMGTFYVLTVSPSYRADVEIYITTAEENNPYSDIQISTLLTEDYVEVIKSRYVLGKVIEELELDMTVEELSYHINIQNPENTHCLMIFVFEDDPVVAKNIANKLLEVSTDRISKVISKVTPSIVDYADMSSVNQYIPSFKKYIVVGAFAGAAIVSFIYLLLMIANTTIKSEEDIEKTLGLTILATVPYFNEK